MSGQLNNFHHEVLGACLHALHMFCHAHELNLFHSHSLRNVKGCSIFLLLIRYFCIYITFDEQKQCLNWLSEEESRIFSFHQAALQFSLVCIIEEHKILILECFGGTVVQMCAKQVITAVGYNISEDISDSFAT
jgi:hypothetical protein